MATERMIRRAIRQQGLTGLTELCRESMRIEKALHETVRKARESGYTWEQIGHAIGMSKQGAWRRFTRGPLAR
jgi:predicted transcriptional regulator